MLELPDSPTDSLQLADWLEIYALLSPDGNSSRGDLESALRVAALHELDDDEDIELKCLEVFDELEQRSKASGEAYPFGLDYSVLQTKSNWEDFPAYIFCLCLSYFGWTARRDEAINPRKLFEKLSCLAAKRFLQGNAVDFGPPRRKLPTSFPEAITVMCKLIGSNSRFGVVSPIRTAHKPKRGDSVRVDGPREEKTGLRIGILTSLILPNEVSGYSRSGK